MSKKRQFADTGTIIIEPLRQIGDDGGYRKETPTTFLDQIVAGFDVMDGGWASFTSNT